MRSEAWRPAAAACNRLPREARDPARQALRPGCEELAARIRRQLPAVVGRRAPRCQSALNWAPLSASKRDPFERLVLAVALAPSELAGVATTARARAGN